MGVRLGSLGRSAESGGRDGSEAAEPASTLRCEDCGICDGGALKTDLCSLLGAGESQSSSFTKSDSRAVDRLTGTDDGPPAEGRTLPCAPGSGIRLEGTSSLMFVELRGA
jgi:hypothetical protein